MPQKTPRPAPSCADPRAAGGAVWRSRTRSAVSSSHSSRTSSATGEVAPISSSSTVTLRSVSCDSCGPGTEKRRETTRHCASPDSSVDLASYYTFSTRAGKGPQDDAHGLSGFLEYRKINGTWRPFLFQTSGHQLVLYRVHATHQVLVMSTDIRSASEIALECDGLDDRETTRLLRLGINGATITLRAVTHRAAVYWVEGLRRLRDGKALQTVSDAICTEAEEDLFVEIDKLLTLREWTPRPPPASLCGLCVLSSRRPEPTTAGVLMKNEDEGKPSGCRIC
ncbi:unnamed protein product [Hyaloperonospora brassicae]|uniref:PH domain-containing protein n=1 Tax=Hyaloperonospora brassicae TaxID=162125 RepID=A0AAV0SXY5_HYABA|nr:unnamed protein product [Hyaloperonospora brassicae]